MATPAKESGFVGPFRRRPSRPAVSTPYARPPTALRGVRGTGHLADGGGWISKLFDPASRLIASGASRIFSSMFQKRLTAPPAISEEDHQSREDVSRITAAIPSSEIRNSDSPSEMPKGNNLSKVQNGDTPSKRQTGDWNENNQTNNSDSSAIAKLEQLLEQKTFTRVESDRLAELLRSRMVETANVGREKDKPNLLVQEDGIGSSRIHIHIDEAASPEELAKAYMGSRPSNALSVGRFHNQVIKEDANLLNIPSTSKRLDLSATPRCGMRFSGIPEQSEHGYRKERPPGRSAIYRMSRSPYFKANPVENIQVGELSRDGSSSQRTPSAVKSQGRQGLKRGSAALDGEFGSFGPIRRIRQKHNLMSSSKVTQSSLPGNFLSSPTVPSFKDVFGGSTSVQKPLLLDERKYVSAGSEAAKNVFSNATMVPSQSSETAQKLLKQLDKLLPSPEEKSTEPKIIARDESPSKLTLGMLHRNALRSTEDIPSYKFFTTEGSGKMDIASASHLPKVESSYSLKLDIVRENGPDSVSLGMKSASEANGVSNAPITSENVNDGVRSENMAVAKNNVAYSVPKKPAFRMTAPEDSFELDDDEDDDNVKDPSVSLTTAEDDADTNTSKQTNVISETVISESPTTLSRDMPVSCSVSLKKADKQPVIAPGVTEKSNGFVFPVASDPFSQFQPSWTPIIPTPKPDGPEALKEQKSPTFSFGSKDANSLSFSSTTSTVSNTSGVKVDEGSGSKRKSSTSSQTTTSAEGSALDKNEKEKAGDIFISFGNTVSSGMSTLSSPAIFGFGTSAASSLSNGSLHPSSPAFAIPAQTPVTLSEGPVSSISINSTATATSSSSLSVSSAAATFSTVPSIQFGSDISMTAPVSVSQPVDRPNSPIFEGKSIQASPLCLSSSTVQGTSVFPSVSFFSSGSLSSALSTPVMSPGTSSSSAPSSLFSSMAEMSSSAAMSSAFPSTSSNVFGFNALTQSTSPVPSFTNSSTQNSTTTVFGANGGSTSSSPLFANNSSQNSTADTTSANGVSVFSVQSTQPGSITSQITQSSTTLLGSFSSSPSFGFGNSSSGGFGASPIAPAISSAKPFSSGSGFSFSSCVASSTSSSSSFGPAATPSLFGSNSQPSANSSPSTGFSFGSSSASRSSAFVFGSSSGSTSSTFTFGASSGSSSTPFKFGSSTPSSPAPVFGISNPAVGLMSSSPGNDQMNEDSMTDDTNNTGNSLVPTFGQPANSNQAGISSVPTFGQPANNPQPAQSFIFGSTAVQPSAQSAFQFGGNQNPSFPQNPSSFQPTANVEFAPGGSFSLGSGGGDKSGRRYVKVKRDKLRRK